MPASPSPPCQCPISEVGEVDHPPRDAAMGEEVAGQDEERDRHDLEALDAREELHRDRFDRHRRQREQESHHGETERDRNRNARQHQRDQQHEDGGGAHGLGQHENARLLGEADREDQDRRQDQDDAQRADLASGRPGREAGRLGVQRGRDVRLHALDMRFVVVRQRAGPEIEPRNLQEAEAHQAGAERDRQIDEPHRRFEIVRLLAGLEHLADEGGAEGCDHAGEERAAQKREQDHLLARLLAAGG